MITSLGLNAIASGFNERIVALNYYINGVKNRIDIDSSEIQNSILTKTITFSGIDGTITKVELVDSAGNILVERNDNIILTSAKDLLVRFSFNNDLSGSPSFFE